MGFLKRFLSNVFRAEQHRASRSSFESLSDAELEAHLGVNRYGSFVLSDAIRPSFDLQVIPREGYRWDLYQEEETGTRVPVIMASASKEKLFDLFLDLLDPLGPEVDVVLETSHDPNVEGHVDLYREHIDLPVLKSTLYDFEDLLLNDGCSGVAVLNPGPPLEVQFDEHKLLVIYGEELAELEDCLRRVGLRRDDALRFLTEAEHVHSTSDTYLDQFEQLRVRLGLDG